MPNVLVLRIVFDVFSSTVVLVFLGLRLYHQWNLRRALEKSDMWANASIIFSTMIFTTWIAFSTKTRIELLEWEKDPVGLPPPITTKGHKLHFIGGFAYVTALWLVKSAFLATYYRLIPTLHTKVRRALYFTSIFTVLTFIANILLHGLYCLPIQTNWTAGPHNCTTFRSVPSLTANTFTNVATDLLILGLPLFIIKSLKLKRREGYALIFVFLVGFASTVASILRWVFIYRAYSQVQDTQGAVYKIEIIKVWTTAEISTASVAFCLPVLRNLLRKRWFSDSKNDGCAGGWGQKRAIDKGDSGVDAGTPVLNLRDIETGNITMQELRIVEADWRELEERRGADFLDREYRPMEGVTGGTGRKAKSF